MLRYILLLTYTPVFLEMIRQGYEPALGQLNQLGMYTKQQIAKVMVCHCRVCVARRELGQNTFH
jgi:hypothetical protein